MALEKRCTEYQTMDELFSDMEDDLMALMLWKRDLACIEHILRVLGETLGVTLQHLIPTISGNDKELSKILVMAEVLENGMMYMEHCITSVSHVLKGNGYEGRKAKRNEKNLCLKG
jgi:hypothetical protein